MQQEALCIAFESIVGKQNCITNPGTIKTYLEDWRGAHVGSTPIVLLPNSTGEISRILQICFENNIGGNTSRWKHQPMWWQHSKCNEESPRNCHQQLKNESNIRI